MRFLTRAVANRRLLKRKNLEGSLWTRDRRLLERGFAGGDIANHCDANLVTSPFPPIPEGPFPPLHEFVSQRWVSNGGPLSEKVAIIDGHTGQERTFDDYYQTMSAFAHVLREDYGVKKGGTVAVYSPNHVDYLSVVMAVASLGAKVTPINPYYTKMELEKVLQRSRSTLIVAHPSTIPTVLDTVKECPDVQHVVMLTEDKGTQAPGGLRTLDQIVSEYANVQMKSTVDVVDVHTLPVCLPYSSGTTGLPKGVSLSHSNIVANLLQHDIVEGDVFLGGQKLICPLPFFHIYAFTVAMLYPAWKGQTVITSSGRFDLERFCEMVEQHRPDRSNLVPPIILGLAQHPAVGKYDVSSLKTIVSAAAPLSVDVAQSASKRLGGALIKEAWGMSELSPIGTINHDKAAKAGSIGPLAPSTVGKIIDMSTGESLPPNTPGELLIKGPQVMMGYMEEPDKTSDCLSASGWLRTGDVAHYDEDGYFYITDRIKELIKTRGFQVAPAELEALLLTNEAIQDVAVIPFPDEKSGEVPRAYVVLKPGASIDEEQIKEWVKVRVAPFKRLDGGVVFTDAIPKSASGKILRRVLRDRLRKEVV